MKKYLWFLGVLVALLFASCTDFFDLGVETFDVPTPTRFTYLQFENTGTYDVTVYDDFMRQHSIDAIKGQDKSSGVRWEGVVNSDFSFYLTYHLPLITGYTMSYNPPVASAVVESFIRRYDTTTLRIPPLAPTLLANEGITGTDALVNDVFYLIIKNNGLSGFRLRGNGGFIRPEGSNESDLIGSNSTGVYKVPLGFTPEPVSSYELVINTIPFPMPDTIGATFQKGYCYSLVFDGTTVSLAKEGSAALITLNNINDKVW